MNRKLKDFEPCIANRRVFELTVEDCTAIGNQFLMFSTLFIIHADNSACLANSAISKMIDHAQKEDEMLKQARISKDIDRIRDKNLLNQPMITVPKGLNFEEFDKWIKQQSS